MRILQRKTDEIKTNRNTISVVSDVDVEESMFFIVEL